MGAAAALTDFEFQKQAKAHNDKWLPWLVSEVENLGFETSGTVANFVLFRIPEGAEAAQALELAMTEKGFIGRVAHQNALPRLDPVFGRQRAGDDGGSSKNCQPIAPSGWIHLVRRRLKVRSKMIRFKR